MVNTTRVYSLVDKDPKHGDKPLANFMTTGPCTSITEHGMKMLSAEQVSQMLMENYKKGKEDAAMDYRGFEENLNRRPWTLWGDLQRQHVLAMVKHYAGACREEVPTCTTTATIE